MTTWFIADTHFNEQPKARQRGTGLSGDELDRLIEQRWRDAVGDHDIVWHLGDLGDWQRIAHLPGIKHLVFGNCDRAKRALIASGVFASTSARRLIDTAEGSVLLVHDPAHAGDHDGLVVHGHLHSLPSPGARFKTVSVDQHAWTPVEAAALGLEWPAST